MTDKRVYLVEIRQPEVLAVYDSGTLQATDT